MAGLRLCRRSRGFTLIEVLVVVAIIALLLAILLPSLAAARNSAKLAIDKANCKQIGTMIAEYQAEYDGFVPIIYNYWSNTVYGADAQNCWLSVALRNYHPDLRGLKGFSGGIYDPETSWTDAVRAEYENEKLPEFFVCPFLRGDGPRYDLDPVFGTKGSKPVLHLGWGGRYESYHTWLWDFVHKGTQLLPDTQPTAEVRYSVLTWHNGTDNTDDHRNWERVGDRRNAVEGNLMPPPSTSELTVVYCGAGEFTPFPKGGFDRRANVGSHASSGVGGTHAIFADTHVEWIPGTEIGKP
jgi:prepilin-type N-terminal cleavage/methylation domain-containing protein